MHEVLRELRWDSRLGWWDTECINVTVQEGVVTLTGSVLNYAKKLAAQEAAHRVAGVLDVANDIKVRVARDREDAELARAVRSVLEWDVLVPDENIKSTLADGWVTLEGSVGNMREREDAERAVLHLEGVVGVNNKIVVEPLKVDAEELRAEIEDALERRADREAERLRIEVRDGTVNLWGRVHSWQEKRAVVGSISHAPGVGKVNDHLHIDPYF
jgi:osmotically-inducible protein OsmY